MEDLSNKSIATILFALRFLQSNLDDAEIEDTMKESDHFADVDELPNGDDIDKLCEELNTGTSNIIYEYDASEGVNECGVQTARIKVESGEWGIYLLIEEPTEGWRCVALLDMFYLFNSIPDRMVTPRLVVYADLQRDEPSDIIDLPWGPNPWCPECGVMEKMEDHDLCELCWDQGVQKERLANEQAEADEKIDHGQGKKDCVHGDDVHQVGGVDPSRAT